MNIILGGSRSRRGAREDNLVAITLKSNGKGVAKHDSDARRAPQKLIEEWETPFILHIYAHFLHISFLGLSIY